MNKKGQGALEYLLLIGGAVLVASIVIALITAVPSSTTNPACAAECGALTATATQIDSTICTNHPLPTATCGTTGSPPAAKKCKFSTGKICYYEP